MKASNPTPCQSGARANSIPTRQCLYAGSSSSKACHATHAHGAAVGRCAESSRRGAGRPRSATGGRKAAGRCDSRPHAAAGGRCAESSRRGFTARPRSAAKSQRALAHRKSVQPLTSDDATGCRRGLVVQNGVTKGGALTCERETTPHVAARSRSIACAGRARRRLSVRAARSASARVGRSALQ